MTESKKLCDLRPGESATVCAVTDAGHSLAGRLHDLGLTSGAEVTCTMHSPFGDPCAYLIRGAVIALRRVDAAIVTVSGEVPA